MLVNVGAGRKLKVIETHVSLDGNDTALCNGLCRVLAAEDAEVQHEVLQQQSESSRFVQSIIAEAPVTTPMAMAEIKWTQSEEDITLKVAVDASTKKEDVKFKVLRESLELSVAGTLICQGDLAREVDPEESSWILDNEAGARLLVVTLQKIRPKSALKSARQWPCLWKADVAT
eukprot:g6230.t1